MPDEILADEMCAEVMRDCALIISNFRNRLTATEAAHYVRVSPSEMRVAIESGEIDVIDVSATGSGTGRNKSYRITYLALADWCRRRTTSADPLPR